MTENNSSEQKIKRNKLVGTILAVAMSIVALYFIIPFATDQPRPTGKLYNGTISGVYKPEVGARDSKTKILVTLDDGAIVKVPPANMGEWKVDKRITVEEMSSMRFSIKTYRFEKYIEQ